MGKYFLLLSTGLLIVLVVGYIFSATTNDHPARLHALEFIAMLPDKECTVVSVVASDDFVAVNFSPKDTAYIDSSHPDFAATKRYSPGDIVKVSVDSPRGPDWDWGSYIRLTRVRHEPLPPWLIDPVFQTSR